MGRVCCRGGFVAGRVCRREGLSGVGLSRVGFVAGRVCLGRVCRCTIFLICCII